MENLVDYPCGCAFEKDFVLRPCTKHAIEIEQYKTKVIDENFTKGECQC